MEITIGLAFAAGLISFISPCVLPLVPAYIGYMGGRVTNTVAAQAAGGGTVTQSSGLARVSTGMHSVFFVLGFALVFVSLGLLSTAFIRQVGGSNISLVTNIIGRVGGVLIIGFGLHFMGAVTWFNRWVQARKDNINIVVSILIAVAGTALILWAFVQPMIALAPLAAFLTWLVLGGAFTRPSEFWGGLLMRIDMALYADTRKQMAASGNSGFGGSFLMGIVFAAGWTPCIGPIYGAILTLAANGGDVGFAGTMLGAYSLGLGVPFVLTAVALDGAQGFLRGLNKHMRTIKLTSGAFLIAVGVLVASNQLQRLSTMGAASELAFNLEHCLLGVVQGDVALGGVNACLSGEEAEAETVAREFTLYGTTFEFVGPNTISDGTGEYEVNAAVLNMALMAGDDALAEFAIEQGPALGEFDEAAVSEVVEARINGEVIEAELLNPEGSTDGVLDLPGSEAEAIADTDALTETEEDPAPALGSISEAAAPATEFTVPEGLEIGLDIGNVAPNIETFTATGETVNLAALRGDVVLLNFWATWCGPCRIEMPEFQEKFEELGDDGFTIVAVNNRENADDILAFADEIGGLTFPLAMDLQGAIQEEYGIVNYPSTYLLDEDGVIIARFLGPLLGGQFDTLLAEADL